MPDPKVSSRFEFTGGALCLDFANTVDNRPTERRADLMPSYADLVQWADEAELLGAEQVTKLHGMEAQSPGDAQTVLRKAIQLRESIYQIFAALAQKAATPEEALQVLNRNLREASAQAALVEKAGPRFVWEFAPLDEGLDAILWPVARSAAELLTSPDVQFVRECASDTCAWLFLDKTKNHRRRWCDMKVCGNRAKARRFYARQRAVS
jgi:predicted RNA-binding Zn ribbon-like protein